MLFDMTIPAEFSVRGPHGSIPWVALVDGEPMLLWTRDRETAEIRVRAHHPRAETVRILRVEDPNHHLGRAEVVPLVEA